MTSEHMNTKFRIFLNLVKRKNPNADLKFIEKSLLFAYEAHKGQKRASGEDYFIHCFEIGKMLAELKLDSHTIAAGLLHDVLEDTNIKPDTMEKEFDSETLELVQGVTKLEQIDHSVPLDDKESERAENIRKIMLATSKDVRVIIIKLIDRLHNMRTLKYLPEDKRKVISKETMEIYAPIAHKLGMYNVKAELEDLAFRFIEPKIYQDFKKNISKKKEQREREVKEIIKMVKSELKKAAVEAEVYGRAKHFFSIYKKITREEKEFNEIYDLTAIRIITKTMEECYTALGTVHKLWRPMPKRFKDYIAVPKSNGYQSLHTTVVGNHGRILEVQIRTKTMHQAAEEGIASHVRYKGEDADKRFDRQIEWLKQILDWKMTSQDATDFIESLKMDLFEKEIIVFTPKGQPISLAEDSTPVDFAYSVHTDIGNHCKQAKVNGNVVPLDHRLSPGDIVEIITAKNVKPSRSWLSFTRSSNTKAKIKHALNIATEHKPGKTRKKTEEKNDILDFNNKSIIHNGKKYTIKVSKCCNPKSGDRIKAFRTKEGKVAVHKSDCINIYSYDRSKEIELELDKQKDVIKSLMIIVEDKIGILANILNLLAQEKYNVSGVNSRFAKDGRVIVSLDIKMDEKKLEDLVPKIEKLDSIVDVIIED
ncbi:MAG: RelA/SpoT family protein [Candidatus Woesearchaeota archaeon]